MVFPSAGCQTCKKRRIKCDEKLPVCQKCIKSRRICRRYTTEPTHSVVHLENAYASGQRKRPRGPRSAPNRAYSYLPPKHTLDIDLKTQAVCYYVQQHLQRLEGSPSLAHSLSEEFMPLWVSRHDCPMLDLAVSAVALAVFSKTQQNPSAATKACVTYNELLRTALDTINKLDYKNVDTCLLAIYFMSRYEDTVHNWNDGDSHFPKTFRSYSHHDGAWAILKLWKESAADGAVPSDVIKNTRRGMIRSALMRKLAVPDWMKDGSQFGEKGIELKYDNLLVRIVDLRHHLDRLIQVGSLSPLISGHVSAVAQQLNEEAQDIDLALQQWTTTLPETWVYDTHNLPIPHPWPMRDFWSPKVTSYLSPAHSTVWNLYRAFTMIVNATRLRIFDLMPQEEIPDVAQQQTDCLDRIQVMANDIASSVPFCLERIKFISEDNPLTSLPTERITLAQHDGIKPYLAGLIAWPMTMAASMIHVDFEQKSWFKKELGHLGRITGGGVLESAEKEQWLQL